MLWRTQKPVFTETDYHQQLKFHRNEHKPGAPRVAENQTGAQGP